MITTDNASNIRIMAANLEKIIEGFSFKVH